MTARIKNKGKVIAMSSVELNSLDEVTKRKKLWVTNPESILNKIKNRK